jgi:hypothetical protein
VRANEWPAIQPEPRCEMKFDKRLERLERKVPDPGCPKCRDRRGRLVFVECRRQRDGSVKSLSPMPAVCDSCGVLPELVTHVVHPNSEPRPPHAEQIPSRATWAGLLPEEVNP